MDTATKTLDPLSGSQLYWHMILLVICTIFQPEEEYCYNNVFADVTLYDGHPKYKSEYGFVDWYTWSGWVEAMIFGVMMYAAKEFLIYVVTVGVALAFYASNTTIPFCADGDWKLNYFPFSDSFGLYFDVCKYISYLKTVSNKTVSWNLDIQIDTSED